MLDALWTALPWLPPFWLVLLLLACAPSWTTGRRDLLALGLAAFATFLALLAIWQVRQEATLEVLGVHATGADGPPRPVALATVTRPAWQWPLALAVLVGLLALGVFVRRHAPPRPPRPVWLGVGLGALILLTRQVLETTAAPGGLVWAVGLGPAMPLLLPLCARAAGRRGVTRGGFVGRMLAIAVGQRLLVCALSAVTTFAALGGHLDVHAIDGLRAPFDFLPAPGDAPLARWCWAVAAPELLLGVPLTLAVGVLLGHVPWSRARAVGARAGDERALFEASLGDG